MLFRSVTITTLPSHIFVMAHGLAEATRAKRPVGSRAAGRVRAAGPGNPADPVVPHASRGVVQGATSRAWNTMTFDSDGVSISYA